MAEDMTYDRKWKYFIPNVTSRLSKVFNENCFSDVTLVSDDQKPFQAHRYVLSAFSPVLKNILLNNPHSHPLIYLRGVNHQELDSILQFIYLRKTSVNHNNMKRFAQAAKDLQIKKLAENIKMRNPSQRREDLEDNDAAANEDINENVDQMENEYAGRSNSDIVDEIISHDIPGSDELRSDKQLYKCEECEARYKTKTGLNLLTSSKHGGICFSCKYCGYKATNTGNIKRHQESIHEGIKYPCDKCDYQAKQRSNLRTHQASIHEGIKYPCNKGDYQANQPSSLKTHQESIHEDVKYPSNQCDSQAKQQSNMRRFAQVAKDVQIKKLAENIGIGSPSESVDNIENNDDNTVEDINKENEAQIENEYTGRSISDIAEEIIRFDNPGSDELGSGKQLYKGEECEASNKHRKGLKIHASSKHERICYSCKYCGYKATLKGNLKKHEESIHEGVRYSCDQCDYHFGTQGNLSTHKKSVHEAIRYSCNQCDYDAKQQGHLKRHKKSVHEGVKYSCDQCDYRATQQGNLKNHKESIHGDVKYSCDQCDYRATQQGHLKNHKKSVHEGVKYSCDQCDYQSGWKTHVKEHKQKFHPAQE